MIILPLPPPPAIVYRVPSAPQPSPMQTQSVARTQTLRLMQMAGAGSYGGTFQVKPFYLGVPAFGPKRKLSVRGSYRNHRR